MQEGEAIESRMVSRRIEAAQKKVEERHFDTRKNLLEYDEVMDHQRKRTYGYRQEILDGANCKMRILDMIDEQLGLAVDRFLDAEYGPSSFAEFAATRLGIEFDSSDFSRSDFKEAERTARDKASRMIPTNVHEMMDENLSADVEEREWNWQAMTNQANARWGLKLGDRALKQIGRDNLAQHLTELAEKAVDDVDLAAGRDFLEPDWGLRSLCDWVRAKFGLKVDSKELADLGESEIKDRLHDLVMNLYRQKEIEFPVRVAMARFMAEKTQQGGQRYDREGLFAHARNRFPAATEGWSEVEFRTLSKQQIFDKLIQASKDSFPQSKRATIPLKSVKLKEGDKGPPGVGQEDIDARIEEVFEGTKISEAEDAQELATWARDELKLDINAAQLTGVSVATARDRLWNAFDIKYRPEMRRMERSLLLGRLDVAWKNHLYTMDHLRSGIGLVGYAQVDPKTEYKRQGMKEFDAMWEGVQDKVTDSVFRMEEEEAFQESIWSISSVTHESAQRFSGAVAPEQEGLANQASDKKKEPIRNRGQKVGRNDPCPCGSGKKYKNCHMRQAAG
jgi:preprotein translocase subunit SecA